MRPLDTSFTDRSYTYTQVEREGDLAIFQQQHKENPQVIRYEVVRIRRRAAQTLLDGTTVPDREAYPSSSSWGIYGWTCRSLEDARQMMRQLQARAAAPVEGSP